MENPFDCIENVVKVLDTRNDKDKSLKNSIGDNHALINVAATPETGFVDKPIKIFTE